jgi:uncharacterized protein
VAARTDTFDLRRLSLSPGEGRKLDLAVRLEDFRFGGQMYSAEPREVPVRLEVSRMTGSGYSLRLRFDAAVAGPCMRCLGAAQPSFAVDSREVDQPGGGDELDSPYVDADEELDVAAWARDALALTLPAQIVCRDDCAGLCPQCGRNLNEEPHEHEREPDPRWSKLRELKLDG